MHVSKNFRRSLAQRILGTVIATIGLGAVIAAAAPPTNFVSVYSQTGDWILDGQRSSCWADMHASTGGNDAAEEVAAGKNGAFGKFNGVRPEDVASRNYRECGVIGK